MLNPLYFVTDVLSGGVWRTMEGLQDPDLKRLATCLPDTILHGRADSTTTKYVRAFTKWRTWAGQKKEVKTFPVDEVHFALYLQYVAESTKSRSAVEEAVNSVSWAHQLAGQPTISTSAFVRVTLAGLQRKLAKPKVKKEPVTAEMLSTLVDSLSDSPTLTDVRLTAGALLSFAAFLRYDELAGLRCCDVQFTEEHMSVHIKSSKTDQYRQGDSVIVARTRKSTCPVAMMERYMLMAEISTSSSSKLFRGIVRTKNGERLRRNGSLSYTRMREVFLAKLTALGFDAKQFGLHSLRSGGATAAANAGIPDRLFKRHGRWRSETAKDGYVKDSMAALMSVSESLEL